VPCADHDAVRQADQTLILPAAPDGRPRAATASTAPDRIETADETGPRCTAGIQRRRNGTPSSRTACRNMPSASIRDPVSLPMPSAVQVSTFRSLDGIEYSSAMTTSTLRSVTVNIFNWRTGHDPASRHHAALLASIIAAFAVGAGVGGLCTRLIHRQAAWIAAAALMVVLVAIVIETRRLDRGDTTPPTTPGSVRKSA
jgi:hypothetical protein